jgi:predicted ATP-grasp superfamily ATP-dependent carboligase
MNNSLPYVVVIDIDHINGLQTARIFTDRKIKVIGIAKNLKHYCARTKVCEKIIKSNTKTEELIDTLISVGDTFEEKPLLIPSQDTSVLLVSRNREKLEPYYQIALPSKEVVEMLMDKPQFFEFATRENLPIAKYFLIKNRSEAEAAMENLNFPCIIKPPIKSPLWEENTKIKAYKVYDRDEYLKIYDICSGWAEVLMAQEWIEGTDVDLYSCNCYFNNKNEPLVNFIAKKLRQYPPVTGNTSLGIECRADEVRDSSLELFRKVNYHGLGYVEMKRDINTGKYYMIEPNIGRPTGRSALAEAAGVEILYTMYCDIFGLHLPKEVVQKYNDVKWIQIRTDLMSAFYYWKKGELTLRDWLKSIKGKKFYAVYSLKDPLPFIAEIGTAFKVVFNMLFSKSKQAANESEQKSKSKSEPKSESSVITKSGEKVAL